MFDTEELEHTVWYFILRCTLSEINQKGWSAKSSSSVAFISRGGFSKSEYDVSRSVQCIETQFFLNVLAFKKNSEDCARFFISVLFWEILNAVRVILCYIALSCLYDYVIST